MLWAVVFTGLVATGLVAGWATTFLAPSGYQDERGFHYGAPARRGELPA
jgi:hypothetical protein